MAAIASQEFAPDLTRSYNVGSFGTAPGRFYSPGVRAFGPAGLLYVADTRQQPHPEVHAPAAASVDQWGGLGSGIGQFYTPSGIAADNSGDVYVVEWNNHRVQKFGNPPTPTTRATWGAVKSRYR